MTRPMFTTAFGVAALMAGLAGPAAAQVAAPDVVSDRTQADCAAPAGVAEPATTPDSSADATAAENTGTSGWSGGTGGSQLGTNGQGAVEQSLTWQPPTARGLDLKGKPELAAAC